MRTSLISAPLLGAILSFPSHSWASCRIPSEIRASISTHYAIASHSSTGPLSSAGPHSSGGSHSTAGPHSSADPHSSAGPHSSTDPHSSAGPHSATGPHSTTGPHSSTGPVSGPAIPASSGNVVSSSTSTSVTISTSTTYEATTTTTAANSVSSGTTTTTSAALTTITNAVDGGDMSDLSDYFTLIGNCQSVTGYGHDGGSDDACAELIPIETSESKFKRQSDLSYVSGLEQSLSNIDMTTNYTIRFYYNILKNTAADTCKLDLYFAGELLNSTGFFSDLVVDETQGDTPWVEFITSSKLSATTGELLIEVGCTTAGTFSVYLDSLLMSNQVTPENVDSFTVVSSDITSATSITAQTSTSGATVTTSEASSSSVATTVSTSTSDATVTASGALSSSVTDTGSTSATSSSSVTDTGSTSAISSSSSTTTVSTSTTSSSETTSSSVATTMSTSTTTSSETTSSSVATTVSTSATSSSSSDSTISTSATSSSSSSTIVSSTGTSSSSLSSTSASASASATATTIGNTATTRSQWGDYSIDTDYNTIAPDTGVTREYWFELSEVTVAPDGVSRYAMAINGSIPGPTIYANWGDTVTVHVTNALSTSHNGTSLHFHGIRQNYTNQNDGVASITQCPTPPGSVETYTWRAVQYGSTWYHSHFALQAWEGVFGGIIINGPASENYDEDLGIMFLNDWDHSTVDELWADTPGGLPTLETGLINGTNVWGDDGSSTQVGHRWNTSFVEGTSYRLRLVNGAINSHFKFMVDNHTLTVIASDLVPITPYQADYIDIGIGQRYDVIITANQASVADSFWLRAIPQHTCSDTDNADNVKGIIYYGSSTTTPTTSAYTYTDSCDDETSNLVPVVQADVGADTWETTEIAALGGVRIGNAFSQRWTLNSTSMTVDWENPSLLQIYDDATFDTSNAIIELDGVDEWAYLVVETSMSIPHPIHLHGHDFYILAQGSGDFSKDLVNLSNPPRRDTAMLPGQGYLAIAFKTDNPGAWLMHCHIGWHTTEGFAIQFIERKSEIMALTDTTSLASQCDTWSAYQSAQSISQGTDSGI